MRREAFPQGLKPAIFLLRIGTAEAVPFQNQVMKQLLGKCSMASLTPDVIAQFRDDRLAGKDRKDKEGNPKPRANDTVRLELALLSSLYTIAIEEWKTGLVNNPVLSIRRPQAHPGRDRRLSPDEEKKLFGLIKEHGNLMLGWIAGIALETSMREGEIENLSGGSQTPDCFSVKNKK